ncbi:Abi family protein [Ureaplasma ceti]|uniref:Abortive infection bacteriophage resistance protein n=1 Tax=Ureaplasma ceti TaxID=3119530 RepID=A0ABP9U654_9BACT
MLKTPKNISYDFKALKRQGMRIWSKKKLSNFVFQYGQTRVLRGYASCLIDNSDGKFISKTTSRQLMKLVNFDGALGVTLLKYLFDFEQRLNSVMITTILANYKLSPKYVLDIDHCDWLEFRSHEDKENFRRNMYQNADSCNFLSSYPDKDNIPLMSLALSWTFFNTLAFFEATADDIKREVIDSLGLTGWDVNSFRSLGHIIRKLRNTISHNDCLLLSKYDASETLINALSLNPKRKYVYVYDVCTLLDEISSSKKSLVKEISKLIKKSGFRKPIRSRVGKLLGWNPKDIRATFSE